MRQIWSQNRFWGNVRDIWIAVAEAQKQAGVVTEAQVNDLKMQRDTLSVERILQLEKSLGHDVAAAIAEYSEVAPEGGKILHNGLTSEDVLSNAEIKQIHEAFALLRPKLKNVLTAFGDKILQHKDVIAMGWTHLQAAEPIPVGYRMAKYAQDFLTDLQVMDALVPMIKGKGIKGPVGTSASVEAALVGSGMSAQEHEQLVMERLGLDTVDISDQTYPRKFLFLAEQTLANIGQSAHRFALDVQMQQSTPFGEVSEPRRRGQVGSSAMPHKQNPIISENIDSLSELFAGDLVSAWINGAFVTMERTLRDSAGKRIWLPSSFLIADEVLTRTERVIKGLKVHEDAITTNFERYAPFAMTEIILGKLTAGGMDRKEAHALLVDHAEHVVDDLHAGKPNTMKERLLHDPRITQLVDQETLLSTFESVYHHVGNAPQKCEDFVRNSLQPALTR